METNNTMQQHGKQGILTTRYCNNANNINSEEHGQHEIPEMTNHAQQKHLQQCDAVAHDYQGNT